MVRSEVRSTDWKVRANPGGVIYKGNVELLLASLLVVGK